MKGFSESTQSKSKSKLFPFPLWPSIRDRAIISWIWGINLAKHIHPNFKIYGSMRWVGDSSARDYLIQQDNTKQWFGTKRVSLEEAMTCSFIHPHTFYSPISCFWIFCKCYFAITFKLTNYGQYAPCKPGLYLHSWLAGQLNTFTGSEVMTNN